jgi:hypothetical protein
VLGVFSSRPPQLGVMDRVRFCVHRLFGGRPDLGTRFLAPDATARVLDSAELAQHVPCSEPAAIHSYACAISAVSASRIAEQITAFADCIRSVVFDMRLETDFRKTVIPVHIANLRHLLDWGAALSEGKHAQHLQCLPRGAKVLGWLQDFTMYIRSVQPRLVALQRKRPGPSPTEIQTLITEEIPRSLAWLFDPNVIPEQSHEASRIHARLLDDLALDADVISRRCLCPRRGGTSCPVSKTG